MSAAELGFVIGLVVGAACGFVASALDRRRKGLDINNWLARSPRDDSVVPPAVGQAVVGDAQTSSRRSL